jgi:hypothetical protein
MSKSIALFLAAALLAACSPPAPGDGPAQRQISPAANSPSDRAGGGAVSGGGGGY